MLCDDGRSIDGDVVGMCLGWFYGVLLLGIILGVDDWSSDGDKVGMWLDGYYGILGTIVGFDDDFGGYIDGNEFGMWLAGWFDGVLLGIILGVDDGKTDGDVERFDMMKYC